MRVTGKNSGRYSGLRLIKETLTGHRGWKPAWRDPEPKKQYDIIIVGGGGHGLATAHYLASKFDIRSVAVIEKGWIGGGNVGRNTTIIRSNYLQDPSAAIYEKTSLPPRVREVARLRIAAANGCPVCLNTRSAHATEDGFDEATIEAVVACDLGGVHTLGDLDERERLAGEFADRFAADVLQMTKVKVPKALLWNYKVVVPLLLFALTFISVQKSVEAAYDFPGWGIGVGWAIALASSAPIAFYALRSALTRRPATIVAAYPRYRRDHRRRESDGLGEPLQEPCSLEEPFA